LFHLSDQELGRLRELNAAAYRERFGFSFVIRARLNSFSTILDAMKARISYDPAESV